MCPWLVFIVHKLEQCVYMAGFIVQKLEEVLPAPGPGLRQCPGCHEVRQAAAGEVLPCRLLWTGGSLFCITFLGQIGLSFTSPSLDRWVSLPRLLWTGGSLFCIAFFGQVGLSSALPSLDRWVSLLHRLLWTGGSLFHVTFFGQVGLSST